MDKNGVALGHITVITGAGDRVPYGLELVKRGLARVDDRGTTALPIAFANALQAAQAEAQAAKRGLWCVASATALADRSMLGAPIERLTDMVYVLVWLKMVRVCTHPMHAFTAQRCDTIGPSRRPRCRARRRRRRRR